MERWTSDALTVKAWSSNSKRARKGKGEQRCGRFADERENSRRATIAMRTLLLVSILMLVACNRGHTADGSTETRAEAGDIAVGKPAPDFSATAHDGTKIQPTLLKGKPIVLYFYPKDETPGCTKEACAFRDAWKELEATGVVLVGISTDNDASHKKFAEHHGLPFHLVSDESGAIARAYGVSNRLGFLSRNTIVIGADGNVKKIYRSVDVANHAAEILADVKS